MNGHRAHEQLMNGHRDSKSTSKRETLRNDEKVSPCDKGARTGSLPLAGPRVALGGSRTLHLPLVFTIPKMLRPAFLFDRRLSRLLCRSASTVVRDDARSASFSRRWIVSSKPR